MNVIRETNFEFENQTAFYRGKVRDVYTFNDKLLMVASDRISAFDVVLPRAIPCKGQVLNQIAEKFLKATSDIVPNWLLAVPDPNVSYGLACKPFAVEMVIRNYLVGHAWRTYKSGLHELCGVKLPDGLKENDRFPHPVITPTTKAHKGHDEDISREEIIAQGVVDEKKYEQLEKYALALFERGTEIATQEGLILVDTKYEFGELDGKIYLIDEVHTPDSSRYFYANVYEENQRMGLPQKQLSKEFVREWLIQNDFQGKGGQRIPEMTDEKVVEISKRYVELYEKVTGESFKYENGTNVIERRIEKNVTEFLKENLHSNEKA